MTVSQIIACAISVTAAIVSITMFVLTARRDRSPRYDVQWPTAGGSGMFVAKGLTEEEFDRLVVRLKARDEEEPGTPPHTPTPANP